MDVKPAGRTSHHTCCCPRPSGLVRAGAHIHPSVDAPERPALRPAQVLTEEGESGYSLPLPHLAQPCGWSRTWDGDGYIALALFPLTVLPCK